MIKKFVDDDESDKDGVLLVANEKDLDRLVAIMIVVNEEEMNQLVVSLASLEAIRSEVQNL